MGKPLKESRQLLRREPLTAITNIDPPFTLLATQLQLHPLAAQVVVDGIEQQVLDQTLQERGVGEQLHATAALLTAADGLHRSPALQQREGGQGSQHRGLDVMGKGGDHVAAKIRLPQFHLDRDA